MPDSQRKNRGGRLLVLTYHYIREKGGPYAGIHPIRPDEISAHIRLLKEFLHPATKEEVSGFAKGESALEHDSFFLTFDDGLKDHHTAARKVLKAHKIKGAFFICTRPLESFRSPTVHKVHWLRANTEPEQFLVMLKKHLPPQWSELELTHEQRRQASMMHIHDEENVQVVKYALNFLIPYEVVDRATSRMLVEKGVTENQFCKMTFMSKEEIAELSSEGHIIGLHGHDHAPLSSFDPSKQESDLDRNASILEKIIGFRPTWLSYPYGRPDALPKDPTGLCQRTAVSLAFTLVSGFNETGVQSASLCRITPNELKSYLPADPMR